MPEILKKNYESLQYLIIALVLWVLIYHQTLLSMVAIWWRSETFTHGFLIFPISLYLIYQKRERFNSTPKQHSFVFMALLFLTVLLWVVANAVDVLVIQQLMVVLMLPLIVGSLYGFALVKQYLFPFFYLLFAVPMGEFLVPKLQQITAIITVFGLELSQIPVFYEGFFISVPAGDFEVAVACSGIRYLIASLALGTLYAYLMYTSYLKRGIFMLASLLVPIIANGIRAYGIVLIAQLSDMKYATGLDHLIYGWLFFGFVIFILFYIGSFWEDKPEAEPEHRENEQAKSPEIITKNQKLILSGIAFIMLTGPGYALWMSSQQQANSQSTLQAPSLTENWHPVENMDSRWTPVFINSDKEIRVDYKNKETNNVVYFYKNEYLFEQQGKELINMDNMFYDIKQWIRVDHKIQAVGSDTVIEYTVRSNQGKIIIWGWYEVMGIRLTHPMLIKIIQAWGKMSFQDAGGRFTAIASPYFDNEKKARLVLKSFYEQNF